MIFVKWKLSLLYLFSLLFSSLHQYTSQFTYLMCIQREQNFLVQNRIVSGRSLLVRQHHLRGSCTTPSLRVTGNPICYHSFSSHLISTVSEMFWFSQSSIDKSPSFVEIKVDFRLLCCACENENPNILRTKFRPLNVFPRNGCHFFSLARRCNGATLFGSFFIFFFSFCSFC
jgi:hypothetical protein